MEATSSAAAAGVLPGESVTVEQVEIGDNSVGYFNPDMLQKLNLFKGDAFYVKSHLNKMTVLIALTDHKIEFGKVKLNKTICKNIGVYYGNIVQITSTNDLNYLKKVHVLPYKDTLKTFNNKSWLEIFIIPYFKDAYRPLMKGDSFDVKVDNQVIQFKVVDCESDSAGIVAPDTQIFCEGEPLDRNNDHQIYAGVKHY